MKKWNSKQVALLTGTSLTIAALIFGALIFSKLNTENVTKDNILSDNQDKAPVVEAIEEVIEPEGVVAVPKIQDTETKVKDDDNTVVSIDEPMPEPPEKPKLEAPKDMPETNDDLEDMNNVPEYEEEDLVIESEEVFVVNESQETTETESIKESESNLVSPSENPFANPENAGKPVEIDGSDLSDFVPGTGDKF
ncbi:hypothetical protein [Fusibacter ferrireducens]|uniref:Uncharacterized protein n=1 Tax=Fusibacter ferrireducens TaxID=2785058 RepID=A0ABR9ZP84_9FIRM|nr:hypothetical protein [Fusibacter ferrireducens]MBF4692277.1 hypothetical protein [Fusibacter ferrireducens]